MTCISINSRDKGWLSFIYTIIEKISIYSSLFYLSYLLVKVFLVIAISFNQPNFCPSATWNSTGITFANNNTVGMYPYGIFVNINNTVYVANRQNSLIQVWFEGNITPTTITAAINSYPISIFVTITNDIYVDNNNNYIDEWTLNSTSNITTLYVGGTCCGLFIDSNSSLYCSLCSSHQVIKRSLNSSNSQLTVMAGTGCSGFLFNMLYGPQGIFVDTNFNLYVADSGNNRIQLFQSGQANGTTVAGIGAPGTITLHYPTDVVLDADGYLFIVDSYNFRIVGSGPTGFRCVVGCFDTPGSASDQLYYPWNMAFYSYGNIFVTDTENNRIQKFILATNSCGKYYNMCLQNT